MDLVYMEKIVISATNKKNEALKRLCTNLKFRSLNTYTLLFKIVFSYLLQKMSLHIVGNSSASLKTHPTNNLTNFTNVFRKPINNSADIDYSIALESITLQQNFFTYYNDEIVLIIVHHADKASSIKVHNILVPRDTRSAKDLFRVLKKKINKIIDGTTIYEQKYFLNVNFDSENEKIIFIGKNLILFIPNQVAEIFGFTKPISKVNYNGLVWQQGKGNFNDYCAAKFVGNEENDTPVVLHTKYLFNWRRLCPKLINVQLDKCNQRFSTSGLRQVIGTFSPNLSSPNNQITYEKVGRKEYHPINVRSLSELTFTLTNENHKILQIPFGCPTVIQLHLKKMITNSFLININSRDATKEGLSSFVVNLPTAINLPVGPTFEVALASINYPTNIDINKYLPELWFEIVFVNLSPSAIFQRNVMFKKVAKTFQICSWNGVKSTLRINIKKDFINTNQDLIDKINNCLQSQEFLYLAPELSNRLQFLLHKDGTLLIKWNPIKNEIVNYNITLSPEMAFLCGSLNINTDKTTTIKIPRSVNNLTETKITFNDLGVSLSRFAPSSIMMYSDIVKQSSMGGNQRDLLSVFPFKYYTPGHQSHHYEVNHLQFKEVTTTNIDSISFEFRCANDQPIYFLPYINIDIVFSLFFRLKNNI